MKRLLLLCSLLALTASCARESGLCTIKGVVKGPYEPEGASLTIAQSGRMGGQRIPVEADGTFTLKVPVDETVLQHLFLQEAASRKPLYPTRLIAEEGTVRVVLDRKSTVKGGPLNRSLTRLQARGQSLGEAIRKLNPSDADFEARAKALSDRYRAECEALFRANRNNVVGLSALNAIVYGLSLEELDSLLADAAPWMREDRHLQQVRASKAAEAATAGETHEF